MTKSRGLSLRVVRQHCIDCSGDSFKAVLWCPAYGCHLWRFRLGLKPTTIRAKYGNGLITPNLMPAPNVNLDVLPSGIEAAAAYLARDRGDVAGSK